MLARITSYAVDLPARLLAQYRTLPRFTALIGELGGAVQGVEDALWGIIDAIALPTATGVWLDRLGAIVGESRDGATDVDYRRFIGARILANRSWGRMDDILGVLAAWAGLMPSVTVTDYPPAEMAFRLNSIPVVDLTRVFRLLISARAAGVGLMFQYTPLSGITPFVFATGSSPEASTTDGAGDATNSSIGGALDAAVRT
jgi:hypothetical protein